jgi:hypothetical protein
MKNIKRFAEAKKPKKNGRSNRFRPGAKRTDKLVTTKVVLNKHPWSTGSTPY